MRFQPHRILCYRKGADKRFSFLLPHLLLILIFSGFEASDMGSRSDRSDRPGSQSALSLFSYDALGVRRLCYKTRTNTPVTYSPCQSCLWWSSHISYRQLRSGLCCGSVRSAQSRITHVPEAPYTPLIHNPAYVHRFRRSPASYI